MVRTSWGDLSKNKNVNCISCNHKATKWFIRDSFIRRVELNYCEECLKEKLKRLGVPI